MKCPKCSYTSFDYLDSCKKCGTDLRDLRSRLQIIAVAPEELAIPSGATASAVEEPSPSFSQAAAASHDLAGAKLSSPAPEGAADDLLSDLNFDESFEGIVEPTSYRDKPKQKPAQKAPAADQDELLDLDFGDVFAEKEEEK